MLKKQLHNKYDSQRLLLKQNGIAWCSFNLEGCVLTINLSESTISDKETRDIPSNLKSNIEGEIIKIDVTSGNTMVKVGETVSKGELLVSGVLQNHSSTLFVHSDGVIIAKTKRIFSAEEKYKQIINKKTKKCLRRYTIEFFNIKIPLYLGNVKEKNSYSVCIKNLKLFNKRIPIKIVTEKYDLLKSENVILNREFIEESLYKKIQNQVDSFELVSVVEGEKEIIKTNDGILMKITYFCEENIAIQDKIILATEN